MQFGVPIGWVKIRETIYTNANAGTWAPCGGTQIVDVECVGTGGSGAGGGDAGGGELGGGFGGGGADRYKRRFFKASLTATVAITCQAAPAGGAAGLGGSPGGFASFGSYMTAYGGGEGIRELSGIGGGSGGGPMGVGLPNAASVVQGGAPGRGNGLTNPGFGGSGSDVNATGKNAVWGGAAGGASDTTQAESVGGRSFMGAGAGGGGGWSNPTAPGDGGSSGPWTSGGGGPTGATGGGGAAGTGTAGNPGTAGADGNGLKIGAGGGGGAASTAGTAGKGGNGGFPGGGGGGGGDDPTGLLGGAGGDAGGSQVRVTEWGPPTGNPAPPATIPGEFNRLLPPFWPPSQQAIFSNGVPVVVATSDVNLFFGSGSVQ